MNIIGLICMLFIAVLLMKIHKEQSGGSVPQMSIENKYTEPYYGQQYRELDDVNNVLNRPMKERRAEIDALVAHDPTVPPQYHYIDPQRTYLDFGDTVSSPVTESDKTLVASQQPYFLDEALVIDYYGEKFYHDARFPRQPISIEFAKDPKKFCRDHPNEYPSYVIASRTGAARPMTPWGT